MPIMTVSTV